MSNFKISVDVNIDLSESTKNFINALLKAEAPKAEAPKATITIDMVRKALSEKVNDNRASIKEKLTSLGAPSVTKLDPSKYEEMYNYLISL